MDCMILTCVAAAAVAHMLGPGDHVAATYGQENRWPAGRKCAQNLSVTKLPR